MRAIILLLIISFATKSMAQITPEEYRAEVVEYSWAMRQAQNNVTETDDKLALSKKSQLPNISASNSFSSRFKKFEGQKQWTLSVEPQLTQTIYGGGAVLADIQRAKYASEAAVCSAEDSRLDVVYGAEYAYWYLWAMIRSRSAMEQYVEIIKRQMAAIERRYDEGYTSKGDLLMIAAQLTEAEYELTSAERLRLEAAHNFNTLRGVAPADSVILAKVSPDSLSVPCRVALRDVVDRRPDYAAARLAELVAKSSTQVVAGGYNPSLLAGVGGSWRSYTPNFNGETYLDGSVFLKLSIPIFHFSERRKAVSVSRASERRALFDSGALLDTIGQQESDAWAEVVASRAQMSGTAKSLRIASENLEISSYSYNEGLVSIVDLMQAQISWIRIYNNAINAEFGYQIAVAKYRRVAVIYY